MIRWLLVRGRRSMEGRFLYSTRPNGGIGKLRDNESGK